MASPRKSGDDRMVSRTYRAAIRLGEDFITLEETVTLPLDASDEEVTQAVDLAWRIYRAQREAADAQIAVLEKSVRDANVTAPISGIVTQKLVDAGEIVARGTPLVVITDLDNAWANLFVPEPMIPRVAIGQPATIFTDAGGAGIEGKVTFISPRAEFTPRNVQTAEERSKLVYRIKVSVDNRAGILKLGMPVDAELKLQ